MTHECEAEEDLERAERTLGRVEQAVAQLRLESATHLQVYLDRTRSRWRWRRWQQRRRQMRAEAYVEAYGVALMRILDALDEDQR